MQREGSHASYSQAKQDISLIRESTCQAEWYTVVSVCMWSDQNNHGKIRINALSNTKWSINTISMSMYSTVMAMKHKKKTTKSSMCNQDMSIHWSSNRIPRLLHSEFKLDPLKIPNRVAILWTPHFGSNAFPTRWRALDFKTWRKIMIFYSLKIWLGVATYFCFIFKG